VSRFSWVDVLAGAREQTANSWPSLEGQFLLGDSGRKEGVVVDLSRMSQGQLITGIGGLVLLISLFLSWVSGVAFSGAFGSGSTSASAFDAFSGMDIIMLIIAILAMGVGVAGAAGSSLPEGSGAIVGLLGVVTFGWALGYDLEISNAGLGAWLALAASAAIAWGGFETTRERRQVARRSAPAGATRPTGPSGPPTA
jgi:hypothetical protein